MTARATQMTMHYVHMRLNRLMMLTMSIICFVSCTNDLDVVPPQELPTAVGFDTYIMQQKPSNSAPTRAAVEPSLDGAVPTSLTTTTLRDWGFGVFAQYVGNGSYSRAKLFDFMFNQKVEWKNENWDYTPVKYWPNDNQPADDQDGDTGNDPATGSGEHGGKLTFFAYAPFLQYDVASSSPVSTGATYGITTMPGNAVTDAHLVYRSQLKPGQDVDLLWAKQDELYKTKPTGEGHTTGRVPFVFQHALSRLDITVMGLFDHASPSDQPWEGYSDDVDESTRILIERITIGATNIADRGRLYIAPKKADNSYDKDATSAYWEADGVGAIGIGPDDDGFNPHLKYTADQPADVATASEALAELGALPTGVDKTERWLYYTEDAANNEQPLSYLFPPNNNSPSVAHDPLTINVKYHVITYDPELTLNTPKYFSIVENDIEATFSDVITFEPNKAYRLRLLLGLTSVKFEVLDVTNWEVPIVLAAVVKDWHNETHEYDVEHGAEEELESVP